MLNKIRKSRIARLTALTLIISLLAEMVAPTAAYALTSGPSQPEVQSFEPIATTDMVDLFKGDFNYNIPIMQVGHYPINLFYHAGVGMDQEASWTGLGWNINPGVINRNMRGIPDDFNGDPIEKTLNIKSDVTVGLRVGLKFEALGFSLSDDNSSGSVNFRLYYNNYKGVGYGVGIGTSNKDDSALNLSLNLDSQDGISAGVSFEKVLSENEGETSKKRGGVGLGFNSRSGLKSLTLSYKETQNEGTSIEKSKGFSSSVLSFVAPTFTPTSTPGMGSFLGSLSVSLGGLTTTILAGGTIGVDVHVHGLMDPTKSYPTAGYLYAENNNDPSILQDINRDKEVAVNKYTKQLHTTNHAFDTYAVSGQGTGGMYRPYRGNVGMVFDPVTDNSNAEGFTGADLSIGLEAGAGFLAELGADINAGVSLSYMGPWESDFGAFDELQFTNAPTGSDIFHEPIYFKTVGEKTTVDQDFYDKIMDTKAVDFPMNSDFFDTKAKKQFRDKNGNTTPITSEIFRNQRDRRNQHINYLTADEASKVGFDRDLKFYEGTNQIPTSEGRATNDREGHHISEIVVTNPDGTRYIYGLPAYNYTQKEYSFSVDINSEDNILDEESGLITYSAEDISIDNSKGRDHYFSKEVTPPYAYAYLLTAVLSPDYVDVNDNGISEDDWGTYTKINYFRAHENFRWITPLVAGKANFNMGMKSDTKDDKANLVYGEKEIFYVHSIETKTHIAEFNLSERPDGKGVKEEVYVEGGLNSTSQSLLKLDKIKLYSKPDRISNEETAIPIKTAHFTYDNSLCDGIPNNDANNDNENDVDDTGKLTLTQLHFTYGNNTSGTLSPYTFDYSAVNPGYNIKGSDRWGNFKRQPNDPEYTSESEDDATFTNDPYSWEYPYSRQDKTLADKYAKSWNLTGINLPSGGHIAVDYESDSYAYVQNQRAAVMTNVIAVTDSPSDTEGSSLYNFHEPHNFIHFTKPVNQSIEDMMVGINEVYFNFGVNLAKTDKEEVITGYAKVVDFGEYEFDSENDGYVKGWVEIKGVKIETGWDFDRRINPVAKAAWQFARVYRPGLAYEGSDWTETEQGMSFDDVIWGVLSSVSSICNMIAGFNQMMEAKGKGREVNLDRSWIRLNAPQSGKFGGGHRVKKIEFSDKWDDMTDDDEQVMSYGQSFEYTDANGNSSGVAAYEPLIGGDENLCRIALAHYGEERLLAPDDDHYVEGPYGEQFFPAPTVGYSMVTVKNIKPIIEGETITRHGSGKTVHEFYTAKEFPVITDATPFDPVVKKPNPILTFLNVYTREYATASQGFSIEVNDMHGKQKAVTVYAEDDDDPATPPVPLVSQVKYFYKVENENLASKQLNNQVLVMDKKGEVETAYVGKDIEMTVDSKEKSDYHMSVGVQINTDIFTAGPIPVIIPIPWPDISVSKRRLRYAVNTKVVNRFGILERTEATQNGGATISTWNEIYDKETGEVLLTRTVNEHFDNLLNHDEDFIYNFNYPAHWAYDRMGPAYKNTGVKGVITIANGVADLDLNNAADKDLYNAFVPGDEVMIYTNGVVSNASKAWVLDKDPNDGRISFINEYGESVGFIGHVYDFKIIRSGRKNQQSASVASVVSKEKPWNISGGDTTLLVDDTKKILNSSATVYSDEWQTPADKGANETVSYTCSLTTGSDIITFLNYLVGLTPSFNTSGNKTFGSPNYTGTHTFVDEIIQPDSCPLSSYSSIIDNNVITINFNYEGAACQNNCGLTIVLPTSIDPEDIISFDDDVEFTIDQVSPGNYSAMLKLTTSEGDFLLPVDFSSKCLNTHMSCDTGTGVTVDCGSTDEEFVNPYLNGLRGIWRPQKGYAYNSTREYSGIGNDLNSRVDGTYSDFDAFWRPNIIGDAILDWKLPDEIDNPDPTDNKWVWTSEVTKYHPAGYEVENKDALGRYSSALFHYWYTQPSALASNAQYREIAFDGFEDYRFQEGYGPGTCHYLDHWSFMDAIDPVNDLNIYAVHTGKKSLEVDEESSFTVRRPVLEMPLPPGDHDGFMEQYAIKPIDKLGIFTPDTLGEYIIGMWVNKYDDGNDYADIKVNVNFYDNDSPTPTLVSSETFDLISDQPVIEGWKRFEEKFTIPDNVYFIDVEVVNENTANAVYFDDIRIHPFNSNMKTFVYDPVSLRLVAQLDENNYATFYEYDDQGNLIRTKKETERGIVTLQENRQSIYKITP